jgi:dienelactone hydrolase
MARQLSFHLSFAFACSLAVFACDDTDTETGKQGVLTPIGGTSGGTSGAGGTTGSSVGAAGGTTGSTGLPGTAGGPGGTTGLPGTAGGPGGTTGGPGGTTGGTGGLTGGTGGTGGTTGGTGGTTGGTGGTTGGTGGTGGGMGPPPPAKLSDAKGPMQTASFDLATGTVFHPTGNNGPWPAIAIIPGFLNVGPEVGDWCPFYASWGIVCHVTSSGPLDTPDIRAVWLADAITALKAENTKASSPLNGKLSGSFGVSGYSMGGGATAIASASDKSLKVAIGLAPWTVTSDSASAPSLHFCGTADITADCSHAQSLYDSAPSSTPKMMITIENCGHLDCWWGPDTTPEGISGGWGLAFAKVYLEGDMRWKSLLLGMPSGGTVQTNIKP